MREVGGPKKCMKLPGCSLGVQNGHVLLVPNAVQVQMTPLLLVGIAFLERAQIHNYYD